MFSKSGKQTLEKFQILLKKDEIINGINKKIKVNDLYTPDEVNNLDTQEDEFKIYAQEPKEKAVSSEALLNKFKSKSKNANKYRKEQVKSKPRKEIKRHENPPCNKYNPNWQYVNKKLAWGVKWDTLKKREFSLINKYQSIAMQELNLYNEKFKVDGKVFLDFNKQTQRGSFYGSGNSTAYNKHRMNVTGPIQNITKIDTSDGTFILYYVSRRI